MASTKRLVVTSTSVSQRLLEVFSRHPRAHYLVVERELDLHPPIVAVNVDNHELRAVRDEHRLTDRRLYVGDIAGLVLVSGASHSNSGSSGSIGSSKSASWLRTLLTRVLTGQIFISSLGYGTMRSAGS